MMVMKVCLVRMPAHEFPDVGSDNMKKTREDETNNKTKILQGTQTLPF